MEKRLLVLLIGLAMLRGLWIAAIPITDNTEGRYAQISLEMARSKDWITPRIWIHGKKEPFLGKPPAFFWAAAASILMFGGNEFAVRFPSLFALVVLMVLVGKVLRKDGQVGAADRAVWMMATCPFLYGMSGVVIVDLMLALGVGGAVMAQYAVSRESNPCIQKYWSLAMFAFLGLGFLTKGPVAIILFLLPTGAWVICSREWDQWRRHAWLPGILLFILITVPWYLLAEYRNPGFLKYFFVNENFLRFIRHDYGDRYGSGHLFPRGSAAWMMLVAAFPWSLPAIPLVWRHLRNLFRKNVSWSSELSTGTFLLFSFLVPTLFWCLARQLLITYMLPSIAPFCAWLALQESPLLRIGVPDLSKSLRPAIAVAGVYFLAGMIALLILSEHATSRIIREAENWELWHRDTGLLFYKRTPNSAYFYAPARIFNHPNQSPEELLALARSQAVPPLVLCDTRHAAELTNAANSQLTRIVTHSEWGLYKFTPTIMAQNAPPSSTLAGPDH